MVSILLTIKYILKIKKKKHNFFHENLKYIPCQHVPMQWTITFYG